MFRILYVDDEPDLLEIAKLFLEETGDFSVAIDIDAEHALPAIRAAGYDAVISDYQMPAMNGIAFLKAVRSAYGDLPFILFTGRGREEVVIEAINNGADFYLQKGGDPTAQFAELAHKIRQAVIRRRTQDELRAAYEQITASEEELRSQLDEIIATQKEKARTETNFRNLVDNAPDAIYIQTRNRFVYLNNAAVRLMGASSAADLLGRDTFERIHPSFHDRIRQRVKSLTLDLKPVELLDEIYLRLDGTPVDVEVTAVPFQYLGEHGALVMVRDITLRKQAEADLRAAYEQIAAAEEELRGQYNDLARTERLIRESEESYRGLFNTVRQAIYIQDADWKFIDVNDGAVAMYGYSREEFVGRTPEFLSAPGHNDLAAVGEAMKKAFSGEPQQFVFWARRKNGEIFPKDVRIYRGTYFGRDVIIAIGTDITRSKQAEEEIRKKQQQLEEIAGTIPGVIYQFCARPDGSAGLSYVSSRAPDLFGISSEPAGFFERFTGRVDPRDRDAFLASIREAVQTREPWEFEGNYHKGDGMVIRFRGISRPTIRGDMVIFSGVLLDITPRK